MLREFFSGILGVIALISFIAVTMLSIRFFNGTMPTAFCLLLSFMLGLIATIIPGFASAWIYRSSK